MSSAGDVLRLRESLSSKLNERESIPQRFRATMGDGTGAVVVPGKPNYVYVRRLGRGLIEECLNNEAAARDGLPIIAGYSHESPDVLQVLEVDWYSFSAPGTYSYTQHHHEAHELHNVHGGDDVVWVQSQQIMLLLVYPTSPASMRVNVFGGWYPWASGWHYFEDTLSADLTAHVPVAAGSARYVLISIDGATEVLQYTAGATFPIFMPPLDAENMLPAPPAGSIPIGAVYLPSGTTALDWDNLYDVRLFHQPVGGSITPGVHTLLGTAHSDTVTDAPTRGSLIAGDATPEWDELVIGAAHQLLKVNAGGTDPAWASFDWDEISAAVAADMIHDHSVAAEGGAVPLTSLGDYIRGAIVRGGAADWEAYVAAKTDKQILVGDGVDIVSVPVSLDVTLANTGAATVVGIQARTVGAAAPADGQVYVWNNAASEWRPVDQAGAAAGLGIGGNPTFKADGVPIVIAGVDGAYVCPGPGEITAVYVHSPTPGTAGSTIIDVNLNGVTIFTVQGNRPTLAWNDVNGVAKSGVPNVVTLAEEDVLTVDIDQVATGVVGLSVIISLLGGGGIIMIEIQEDDVKVTDVTVLNFEGEGNRVTDEGGNKATVALGMWELIEEQILVGSAATVTFAAIPQGYRTLVLQCQARTDVAAELDVVCWRANADAGANYDWMFWFGLADGTRGSGGATAGNEARVCYCEGANSRASNFGFGRCNFGGYALADREKWSAGDPTPVFGNVSALTDLYTGVNSGRWRNTAAITGLLLFPATGPNFVAGSRFTLYGIL